MLRGIRRLVFTYFLTISILMFGLLLVFLARTPEPSVIITTFLGGLAIGIVVSLALPQEWQLAYLRSSNGTAKPKEKSQAQYQGYIALIFAFVVQRLIRTYFSQDYVIQTSFLLGGIGISLLSYSIFLGITNRAKIAKQG